MKLPDLLLDPDPFQCVAVLRSGTTVNLPLADVRQVLEAFGVWERRFEPGTDSILNAVAEAQNLFGGKTFVPLGIAFAELPDLFAEFRAALALGAETWPLQQILLAGLLPQNLLERTP